MRPHPDRHHRTLYCVGAARLVREVAPLLENAARIRWAADPDALLRATDRTPADMGTADDPARRPIACIVEDPNLDRLVATLETIRVRLPRARRLIVVETCDLTHVRRLIETGLADALLYRPLELLELRKAAGLPVVSRETSAGPMSRPRSGASLV